MFLQVDVIESQYNILIAAVTSTRDFDSVKLAHENFLAALQARCFVYIKPVSQSLLLTLYICNG